MSTSSRPCVKSRKVRAVLVHDGEPLNPVVLRAGLVDEHHAAVEIAFLAGEALVNKVRDNMRQPPRCVRRNVELFACNLPSGIDIPEPELAPQPAVAGVGDAADDKGLRVEHAPILKLRGGIHVRNPLDERCRVYGLEKARAIEIRRDDLRDLTRVAAAGKLRDGDRDRANLSAPDLNLDLRRSIVGNERSREARRCGKKKIAPPHRAPLSIWEHPLLSWPGLTRPSSLAMRTPIVSLDGRLKGGHDDRGFARDERGPGHDGGRGFMSAAIHVAWIETKNHVPASFILLRGDRVGRAADRGPDGRVGHGLVGL